MSPDHECPDCGNVHRLNRDERIRRLEVEVARLKAQTTTHYCGWWCSHAITTPFRFYSTWTSPNTTTGVTNLLANTTSP